MCFVVGNIDLYIIKKDSHMLYSKLIGKRVMNIRTRSIGTIESRDI